MPRKIFVNLPVKDLQRSIDFFTALGFTFNQQFTDEKATCMVISDDIYAMLLTEERFLNFTNKKIADAFTSTEVLLSLTCESREEVDELVSKALSAGGSAPNPKQEYDFMYAHGFQDLDGHIWEVFWMDPDYVQPEE
ncbi:MAG: extradiol dioxygenase [Ignavibacteriaceae bacterium]|nr:MAG: extradiol dioxygenase [Ignavibacteriaceae bacterium]